MDTPSEVAVPRPGGGTLLPRPYRVRRRWDETQDTFTMELEPIGDAVEPGADAFRPGQFNMLYAFGVGEVPISISGDPADAGRLVHTIRAVGPATEALRRAKAGDAVGVRGPFGSWWPVKEAEGRDLVFIAGGIGLPPLRPALYQVLAQRERFGRVALLYGARRPEEMVFVPELRRWRSELHLDVLVTVDRATESWKGDVGFVTQLIRRAPVDGTGALAMICGPELMMRFAAQELTKIGFSDDRIHVSLERNMKCGVGLCGHCQFGPSFVCLDGPVYRFGEVRAALTVEEL